MGTVTHVLDGDTLSLKDAAGGRYRIRLASIDAPEKDQPYGPEAALLLKHLVLGKQVEAHIKDTDKYGRLVAHIYKDPADDCKKFAIIRGNNVKTIDICCLMLEQGAAWHLSYFDRFDVDYALHQQLEQGAKIKKVGLWANPYAVPPWKWRVQHK